MKWTVGLLLILMLGGCSAWESRQQASVLASVRQDDEACVSKGMYYPDADYVSCRYNLQNGRMYYQWKCLQMAKCASTQPTATPSPFNQTESYKPLDAEHFRCWQEPQFGGDFIYCGVKGQS